MADDLAPALDELDDPPYTLDEAAKLLKLSPADLEAERRAHGIAYIKVRSGRILFLRSDLAAYLRSRRKTCRARAEPIDPDNSDNGGQPSTHSEAGRGSHGTDAGTTEPSSRSDGIGLTAQTALAAARAASARLANGLASGSKPKIAQSKRRATGSR